MKGKFLTQTTFNLLSRSLFSDLTLEEFYNTKPDIWHKSKGHEQNLPVIAWLQRSEPDKHVNTTPANQLIFGNLKPLVSITWTQSYLSTHN